MGYGLYDAMKAEFEEVTILGKPAILTDDRISRHSVPGGYFKYELCNTKFLSDDPIEIADVIQFNHWATIITRDEIKLPPEGTLYSKQDTLVFNTGDCQSMKEFMDKFPPRVRPPVEYER